MGEMAEMMLDGTMCSQCGVYIGTDNSYPTLCSDCSGNSRSKRNSSKSMSKEKKPTTGSAALNGVAMFINKRNKDLSLNEVLNSYNSEVLKLLVDENQIDFETLIANKIQEDFGQFVTWFKEHYK